MIFSNGDFYKTTRLLVVAIFMLLISCTPEQEVRENPSSNENRLEPIWYSDIFELPEGGISMKPILTDSVVVFSSGFNSFNSISSALVFLDTAKGVPQGVWGDYISVPDVIKEFNSCEWNNVLCLGKHSYSTFVDLTTRTTVKKTQNPAEAASAWRSAVNGRAYHPVSYDGFLPSKRVALLETDFGPGGWDTVYKATSVNPNYGIHINRISGEVASNGDEILYFVEEDYTGMPLDEPNRVVALNRTQDSVLWKFNCYDRTGNRTLAPTVDGNRLYVSDLHNVYCLNKTDGTVLWSYSYSPSGQLGTTLLLGDRFVFDNYVLVKGQDERMVCLDKTTGAVVWTNSNTGASMGGTFEEFEGRLYFIAGARLQVVDIQSGDQLLTVKEQTQFGHLFSSVTIDPFRRVMYFSSDRYAYCVKIPNL